MKDKAFIDTNILVYLYSEDEPEKKEKSQSVFNIYHCISSTQVLNELSNVMTKKFKISPAKVVEVVNEINENCEINAQFPYFFMNLHHTTTVTTIKIIRIENK